MSSTRFLLGNKIRLSVAVSVTNGMLTDVTALTLTVLNRTTDASASYTLAAGQIVHDGVGLYHYDVIPTEPGHYTYRYASTGTVVAAGEASFVVTRSKVI